MVNGLSDISDYIETAMKSWNVPGVALAVLKGDEVLHLAGYGVRNLQTQEPVTPDTRFALASVTKSFTAMGIALLVDEGIVEWDKPVRTYLPTFKMYDPYVSEHISLRDMLCHRSGLPAHNLVWYGSPFTREEIVRSCAHLQPNRGFREAWQYSNLMYTVAGYITEVMANTTWEAFIQQRVFDSLGMCSSNFAPGSMPGHEDYALPYLVKRANQPGEADILERMEFFTNPAMAPAGGIYSNLVNLAQWLKVHLNEGRCGDLQLVSPGNLAQMHQPQIVLPPDALRAKLMNTTLAAYGMGWAITPYKGHTLIHHDGNLSGFSVMLSFIPQKKLGVIVLTNIEEKPLRDVLTYEVYDRVLGLTDSDWNGQFHAIDAELRKGLDQKKETLDTERIRNAPPTHALADYVGDYSTDGYPDFKVKLENDALLGWLAGVWWPLLHYHYDIFELDLQRFEVRAKISFITDVRGNITGLTAPIEPALAEMTFRRRPISILSEILTQFVGNYQLPFDGAMLTIRLKQSNRLAQLVAQITGQTETELIPYKILTGSVEFHTKDVANASIAFTCGDTGTYEIALMKQLGVVYEAHRVTTSTSN